MFNNDLSYLYSDECLTSSFSNNEELPKKVSNVMEYRPFRTSIYRKITPTSSSISHRSKHIILFREEALKCFKRCERKRLATRRLREKHQLFEENLHNKIKQLDEEKVYLENDLRKHQVYKRDLETEINHTLSINSSPELLLMDVEMIPLSLELLTETLTNTSHLNNDMDINLDHQ